MSPTRLLFERRLPAMRELRRTFAFLAVACAATGGALRLARTPMDEIVATAVSAAAAPLDAPAEVIASVAGNGSHVGFDTNIYPGDKAMAAWIAGDSPYEWVGYYLPAACHKDTSWSGKRETLERLGWGTAVIYVGQQSWPKGSGRARPGSACASRLVTEAHGRTDAADAAARAAAEGFPQGTVIFLDIERMEQVSPAMRNYYRVWTRTLLSDGRYRPGIYVHEYNAQLVYADVHDEFVRAGASFDPPFWLSGNSKRFSLGRNPEDVGHVFADVWQGLLDVVRVHNGVRLPVDVSVAAVASPSSHQNDYSADAQ